MKRALMPVFGVTVFCLVGCQSNEPVAPVDSVEPSEIADSSDPNLTVLFDGSSIDGWNVTGDANWTLYETDNSVMANMGSGYLVTPESYSDFVLTLEFWVDEPANSGIFFRCQVPEDINDRNAYEANIYDTRPDQTHRTGGLVRFAAPLEVIDSAGQWNTYEIRAEGERLQVTLNGILTVDIEDSTYSEGPIGLQYGAGIVKFRNVQIRTL